jgi:hypothetical protein
MKSSAVKLFRSQHFMTEMWFYFKILFLATGAYQTVKRVNVCGENT